MDVAIQVPWWLLAIPIAVVALLALLLLRVYNVDTRLVRDGKGVGDNWWGWIVVAVIVVVVAWERFHN